MLVISIGYKISDHRKKSYPHMHVPLKIGSKSMRRRASQQQTPTTTPITTPKDSATDSPSLEHQPPTATATPVSSIHSKPGDSSDIGLLSSSNLQEESDTASESECILSDPCNYETPDDFSPERKVQFQNEDDDTFDVNDLTNKKKR